MSEYAGDAECEAECMSAEVRRISLKQINISKIMGRCSLGKDAGRGCIEELKDYN